MRMARDRDHSFERALAQNLRPTAAKPAGSPDTCSDAELLAAYYERSLAPDESAALKRHIATCASCQQILASLEATDAVLLNSAESAAVNFLTTQAAKAPQIA